MNLEAILALMGDLYSQIVQLQGQLNEAAEREARLTEMLQQANAVSDSPPAPPN